MLIPPITPSWRNASCECCGTRYWYTASKLWASPHPGWHMLNQSTGTRYVGERRMEKSTKILSCSGDESLRKTSYQSRQNESVAAPHFSHLIFAHSILLHLKLFDLVVHFCRLSMLVALYSTDRFSNLKAISFAFCSHPTCTIESIMTFLL
jgi:hypothetical protein